MKAICMSLLLVTSALAQNGTPDTPSRFSGMGTIEGPAPIPWHCHTVAFRSEDLPTPGFKNRFHFIIQMAPGCPAIAPEVLEGPVMAAALPDGRMQIMVREWNLLLLPTDPGVRQFMVTSSGAANGGFEIRTQKLTISLWAADTYEFLIEEPI